MMRVLSFNMHKGTGWVAGKSTLNRIRDEILLLQPDLILLQEICGAQFDYLAADMFPYSSYGKNAVHAKGHHGNAILSKHPIIFSKNMDISMGIYERRGLLHCIAHPTGSIEPLHLICVHLGLFKKI